MDLDERTIQRNIDEQNEMAKSGHVPTYKDIKWTGAEKIQREKDLKQFQNSESGCDPSYVNSDAFRAGWERIFGTHRDQVAAGDAEGVRSEALPEGRPGDRSGPDADTIGSWNPLDDPKP